MPPLLHNRHIGETDPDEKALQLAEAVVRGFNPRSVLDAGCIDDELVQALRAKGVEAYGFALDDDSADLAAEVQNLRETDSSVIPLEEEYDLILIRSELFSRPIPVRAIEDLCARTKDVLILPGSPEPNRQTGSRSDLPVGWASWFARVGFIRNFSLTAEFDAPVALHFQRTSAGLPEIVDYYQAHLERLQYEASARRVHNIEQLRELSALRQDLNYQYRRIEDKNLEIQEILNSRSWQFMRRVQALRLRLVPIGTRREGVILLVYRGLRLLRSRGLLALLRRINEELTYKLRIFFIRLRYRRQFSGRAYEVVPVDSREPVTPHQASVEIIICVHNALEDVQRCLDSVMEHTAQPYRLLLVDDGSDTVAKAYLEHLAAGESVTLLRNEQARGYTCAANQGLKLSTADFVVLLNSDTIVTDGWLDRLIACADSDAKIGLVGPLSNTASWQSIPEIEASGDWAENTLPEDITIAEMGASVARYSERLYPPMTFLNGFCLLIKRRVIAEVGYFDEESFGAGYGEENDYALRARQAGWKLALADDAYIYHAQSRSYSDERRKQLSARAGAILAEKYDQRIIDKGVAYSLHAPVLQGIRARSRTIFERRRLIREGQEYFTGKSVAFILPIKVAGGGGNVVITEAKAMREMGVEVSIINLKAHRNAFEQAHPFLDIPVVYTEIDELPNVVRRFDAVVATFNPSINWMSDGENATRKPVFGYYIQDFEPNFYTNDPEGFRIAWDSYTAIPGLVRFAKTEWTSHQVRQQIGVDCGVVGCSVDLDLFRPRQQTGPDWPERPLRIAAMIRPSSPYRAPRETMEVLRAASRKYASKVEIVIFGVEPDDPGFIALPRDFQWRLAGTLNSQQIASLFNEIDIFLDYSSYQAMGLTALEAMACGAAVVLPVNGGAVEFARHERNSLLIDTVSAEARWEALRCLVEEHDFRLHLQQNALRDVCQYYPEGPAMAILYALFQPGSRG